MALTLKDGKFFEDGRPVPIQFGNKEQIELMNKELHIMQAFKDEECHVKPQVEEVTQFVAYVNYICSCGKRLRFESDDTAGSRSEAKSYLVNNLQVCYICKKKYKIRMKDDIYFITNEK